MSLVPKRGMVLAAGLATRMRPLTDTTAKPLLHVAGRSLLDRALDHLAEAGVERVVVNTHWHADAVRAALATRDRPEVIESHEETLLETGGGVVRALPHLGDDPFYVINGDAFWLDGARPALARLADAFDPDATDAVLLVHRASHLPFYAGRGDFAVDPWGRVRRPKEKEIVPYLYAGVQLVSPALFADAPEGPFSTNILWNRAIAADRLRAVVHDGIWLHLSTPEDLTEAEETLRGRASVFAYAR
ncbi:nucleotidyltransferase family protein [Elioraea tepidiphila]|jgi:MurNAc alpha-1-phosphate uridylyltransferase|uniref:nucleotidyltransferase family protein n=1 Tax=Elioraea tepidiphila TaxID=457934 RepID=UPI00037AB68D|nr:nucleotidyltransferase family protein [Elioraea tepidiphila]